MVFLIDKNFDFINANFSSNISNNKSILLRFSMINLQKILI